MTRMHRDEIEITESLVRVLLEEQFPNWSALPLRRIEPEGTVNAIFRLGDDMSVRLPRLEGPTSPGGKELEWLPKLAPLLPLEIPVPIAQGTPGEKYPWFWEVHSWVQGETASIESIDANRAALVLADFVASLQAIDLVGGPEGRGVPLAERAEDMRYWFARFEGDPAVKERWEQALSAPPWDGPPTWHHGDLDSRNWLIRDGRITGVIDWGSMGVGDPACDVMVAWKLGSPGARDAFREALDIDDATWERARGWALSQAVAILAYYTPENNRVLVDEAESWLEMILSEPS